MSPQVGGIGVFAQPHLCDALKPERRGVSSGSATPHPLSPSMPARTISVRPVRLNVPRGSWSCCGANCTEPGWASTSLRSEFRSCALPSSLYGNQVVATDPLHIMEDITKPRRGSDVSAWVNVIYGCNEHCT